MTACKVAVRCPQSHPDPAQLPQPPLWGKCSSPSCPGGLSPELPPVCPCLSCTGGPQTGCNTLGLVLQVLHRRNKWLPWPIEYTSVDTAEDALRHQNTRVLSRRDAPWPSPYQCRGWVHAKGFAFVLAEHHKGPLGPLVLVCPALKHIYWSHQSGFINRLTEGALHHVLQVSEKCIKNHQ